MGTLAFFGVPTTAFLLRAAMHTSFHVRVRPVRRDLALVEQEIADLEEASVRDASDSDYLGSGRAGGQTLAPSRRGSLPRE